MFYEIFRNDPDPNPDNTETDRSGFTTPWTQQNVRKYTKYTITPSLNQLNSSSIGGEIKTYYSLMRWPPHCAWNGLKISGLITE